MPTTKLWWEEFRDRMPVTQRWAYFDHASVAPLTRAAQDAMSDWAADVAENGAVNWGRWRSNVEDVRRLGAELLNADCDEIAVIRNTTEGINIVAEGFPWNAGDNVVTLQSEFPSNLYPWLNLQSRGVETRMVPAKHERVDLNQVADACDERTRILSVSWVGYATGWRNNVAELAEIAHRSGAYLFLDAIQGLGVFPLDVRESSVDFLAADGHKWLLGPEGAGLLFLRKEQLDVLRPLGLGWNSVVTAGKFSETSLALKPSAGRYEGGSYNMCGTAGLESSLRCLLEFGIERISQRLLEITDLLCNRLEDCGAQIASCREGERRSGIVAFELPGQDSRGIKQRCLDRDVVVNCRSGRVRVSPHAFCSEEDIDRLIAALHQPN